MNKNKHMTADNRKVIEDSLNQKMTYADIARILGKDPTTISKEVKNHLVIRRNGVPGKSYNNCSKQFFCKAVCNRCVSPKRHSFCRNCSLCNRQCPDYEPLICPRRKKTACVCNGCGFIAECHFEKTLYRADKAQEEYRTLLSESRVGMGFTEEELAALDEKVSPLIRRGQSPYHICATNRDSLMVSSSTLYRLIDSGLISARNIDLPRKVRFKARKRKKSVFKVDRTCRIGRDYACFQRFMEENPDTPIIQLFRGGKERRKGSSDYSFREVRNDAGFPSGQQFGQIGRRCL